MKFIKMHGCGNDYVYLDAVTEPRIGRMIIEPGWMELVRRMSDRHRGIGSDGVIVVRTPSPEARLLGAHVCMRMFNADGSESEMCGNGIRCVAKFAHDRLGVRASPMLIETGRGVLPITCHLDTDGNVRTASVNMGEPCFELERIPVLREHLEQGRAKHGEWTLNVGGNRLELSFVSMGNPHAVWFVDDAEMEDLAHLGPRVEKHPAFPQRVNFHIASVSGRRTTAGGESSVRVRTWERGSGITMACGTGACAVVAAGRRTGRLTSSAQTQVMVDGGVLTIEPFAQGEVVGDIQPRDGVAGIQMTGPAEICFEGEWPE
jgi:diaminopimelate epimerase